MHFTNRRAQSGMTPMQFVVHRQPRPLIKLQQPSNVAIVNTNDYKEEVEKRRSGNTVSWGAPFWTLFHTLADKVKPERFPKIREDLLNLIFTICSNLPCPECKNHAISYLNSVNFNTIQCKESLQEMLFQFHNHVNLRKKFPIFPRHLLDERYKDLNTMQVVTNFFQEFRKKYKGSFRLLADDMQRQRVGEQLNSWFEGNIIHFRV